MARKKKAATATEAENSADTKLYQASAILRVIIGVQAQNEAVAEEEFTKYLHALGLISKATIELISKPLITEHEKENEGVSTDGEE